MIVHIPRRRIEEVWDSVPSELREVLSRVPKMDSPPPGLPPDLYHWEILERYKVIKHANVKRGSTILEVCCGPQAFATIALTLAVGSSGRVVALDSMANWGKRTWKMFLNNLRGAGLGDRVIPIAEDARKTPFPCGCFDLVACVHGVRSFEDENAILAALKEMLRVAKKRIFVAETSPHAENKAQKAHLAMYNLRRTVFLARDMKQVGDIHYLKEEELEALAREAGASKIETKLARVNQPHHLAYFPLSMIEKVRDENQKLKLKKKWFRALNLLEKYGEEYPPVVVMTCWK